MIDTGIQVRAIVGHHGVYLTYYLAGFTHIRLMGNLVDDLSPSGYPSGWVVMTSDPDDWLMWAVLIVQTWENATTCPFIAVFPDRKGAWQVATAGESKRKISTVYNEYYRDNMWHVACLEPKGRS